MELYPLIQNSVSRITSQNYVPSPPKHLWEILRMRENPTQQPKTYSFSPPEKSRLIGAPDKWDFRLVGPTFLVPSTKNFA